MEPAAGVSARDPKFYESLAKRDDHERKESAAAPLQDPQAGLLGGEGCRASPGRAWRGRAAAPLLLLVGAVLAAGLTLAVLRAPAAAVRGGEAASTVLLAEDPCKGGGDGAGDALKKGCNRFLKRGKEAAGAAGKEAPKCAAPGTNCREAACCQEEGLQCYEKGDYWATCRPDCRPGPDPTDSNNRSWSCKELGERTPGKIPLITAKAEDWVEEYCSENRADCRKTRCCKTEGMQCYAKNVSYWATCKAACEPGADPHDANDEPWSCQELGSRTPVKPTYPPPPHPIPAITGVNLGGWLCLEDWFFSGAAGRYVDSTTVGQGACLPPNISGMGAPWSSEGSLIKNLQTFALPSIVAHRAAFITEEDFRQIAHLNLRAVRVPLTWAAFADALKKAAPEQYGKHDPEKDTVIVPDPHYSDDLAMATIPRSLLRQVLKWAAKHDLKVIWDLHAFPGGSSEGTYNGVWPNKPRFWQGHFKVGDTGVTLFEAGLWIADALIKWVEDLDEEDQKVVLGLTLMNEPAHLSVGKGWAFPENVLDWVSKSSDFFRHSTLPGKGIRLYVNIVETMFPDNDNGFVKQAPIWWHKTFNKEERDQWAVMDRHRYWAWDKYHSGCNFGPPVCGWKCSLPPDEVRGMFNMVAKSYVDGFYEMFPDGLKAVSEMSIGTFRDALSACSNRDMTSVFLEEQLNTYEGRGIETYFWTWKMPYGPRFEPGWSLKYIAGLQEAPLQLCIPH